MTGAREVVMSAFLAAAARSRSLADFLSESLRGWTVESESVRTLVVMGDDEPLLALSRRTRPVFGCSLAGLLGATEEA